MSLSEEAYGPTPEETFTLPAAFPQTIPEYANDILATPLGVNRPSNKGTLHTATWTHPKTDQLLVLKKLAVNEDSQDLIYTYTLDVWEILTGEPQERYLYREYPKHEILRPEIGHSTPAKGECGTVTENLQGYAELLRTARIKNQPIVFRRGEPNEKVDSEFWYIVGNDFFAAKDVRQEVAQLALTNDTHLQDELQENLLASMCGKPHSLPGDFAKHLLAQCVRRLQAE